MKILWIVNSTLGPLGEKLYNARSNGLWMGALLESFRNRTDYCLSVATTAPVNDTLIIEEDGIIFYALPDTSPILYDENKPTNIAAWKSLLSDEKFDLIQVWGTEFSHGLCALRIADAIGIPSVIYMQGYLGSIARYYLAGMTYAELKRTVTLRDRLKRDSIFQQQQKYKASSEKEKEMLQLSKRIISENEWCNKSIQAIIPGVEIYSCPLSVNTVFKEKEWSIVKCEPHSLICTASGYPLKGLHMVLQAVALLKQQYEDIKLYVPGTKMVSDGSLQWTLRKRGYTKYIEQLIAELNIEQQIVWLGNISQDKLAEQYAKTRAFVLSSSIENHSSSLKEAMMVGVPSVASAVGGVPEYVIHGTNAFLYRFEEYEIMAGYIREIFEDNALACRLSRNARDGMLKLHRENDIYERIKRIYCEIVEE